MGCAYVQGLKDVEEGRSGPPIALTPAEADVYALGRLHAVPVGELLKRTAPAENAR